MSDQLSFIPLGGIGDVTKNMYLYEYRDEILIVDCGLGFADETMLGVDLLLPDISYLLKTKKRIVGVVLTHGHEDHIGALPFVLPNLFSKNSFPIFATPFTASLANGKLKEFGIEFFVKTCLFDGGELNLGNFKVSFIHVTHSIPDSANIFIRSPMGNFYHGSDFKFDDTPFDGRKSDYDKISKASSRGVLCLMSDCLGAEKKGRTGSEIGLLKNFEKELQKCRGKFIVTTYSSHIARLNQIIEASQNFGRHVVFIGRSLLKTKEVAESLGILRIKTGVEVSLEQVKNYPDNKLTFIVAGSQGQENSGMARIVNGEHREVKLSRDDTVVFSADPIPGNEVLVYELIDTIAKKGIRVLYSTITEDFHVSGHGSSLELEQMINFIKPQKLLPIGGNFRHMLAYKNLAERMGYKMHDILLVEDGQEVIFAKNRARLGRKINTQNVYVDAISGEELENFVLRDRQKLSEGGIVVVLVEIDSSNGQMVDKPDIIVRGFTVDDSKRLGRKISEDLKKILNKRKGRVTNWVYVRRLVGEISERRIFKDLNRRPLVLPVVIEV